MQDLSQPDITNEDVKEDISIAKRAKVIPTTLEGVLACQ